MENIFSAVIFSSYSYSNVQMFRRQVMELSFKVLVIRDKTYRRNMSVSVLCSRTTVFKDNQKRNDVVHTLSLRWDWFWKVWTSTRWYFMICNSSSWTTYFLESIITSLWLSGYTSCNYKRSGDDSFAVQTYSWRW